MQRVRASGTLPRSAGVRRGIPPATRGERLLIAVDFGTTFSGVAYATTREPDTQDIVQVWGDGPTSEKVPSVLKYENDDIRQDFKWGFQALRRTDRGAKLHEWFKLGLDPEIQLSHASASQLMAKYPSSTALPPVRPKQCEKLVVDYLRCLNEAADSWFRTTMPREVSALPRSYIITVPAVWSEAAQEATKGCAAEAFLGDRHRIDEIQIIAEPEAAGIYALAKMPQIGLRQGDNFVICDAGGGTVDLASYGINKLEEWHIELEGRATPSGGLCGSSFLNRIFENYLLNHKLKGYINPSNSLHSKWLKSAVDDEFERTIKPEFSGEPGRRYDINAFCFERDSPRHGVRDNMVELTADELRQHVFDIVVTKICDLVTRQIRKTRVPVKAVLLAGGFGQNAYLRTQISLEVGSEVQVLRISDSPTAIVRGALISGLSRAGHQQQTGSTSTSPSVRWDVPVRPARPEDPGRTFARTRSVAVVSRPSPKHYGVRIFADYDESIPLHRRGKSGRILGEDDMPDLIEVMHWFVKKDEQIMEGNPKFFEMTYNKEVDPRRSRPPSIECPVYVSNADEPPGLPSDPSLARPLLTLHIDLGSIPELPTKYMNNRTFYNVNFEIYMTMRSADLEFVLARGDQMYTPQRVKFSRDYADE